MTGIRGRDIVIESQVFLDRNIPLLADLTGATLKALLKVSHRDTDAEALLVLTPTVIGAGLMRTVISSTQSNAIHCDRRIEPYIKEAEVIDLQDVLVTTTGVKFFDL